MYWNDVREFIDDTSGGVLIYVGFMIFFLFGIAGLAIDTGHWFAVQRAAQGTADAAAIAAVYEMKWSDESTDIEAAARKLAVLNGFDPATITVNNPPLSGPSAGDDAAVEVIFQQSTPGFFSALFMGDNGVNVTARSVAGTVGGAPACLIALEPTERLGLELSGGSQIVADGCMVQVNSANAKAVKLGGSGTGITADAMAVVGDIEAGAEHISPAAETGAPVMADPLASLSPPPYDPADCAATDYKLNGGASDTLDPGVYCGGISATGGSTITFNPGIYIIQDGPLEVGGGGGLAGDGVAFYFTGDDAMTEITGGGTVQLSAPTTGPMAGLIFYADPDTAPSDDKAINKVGGGGDTTYEGTVYFPSQDIEYTGGSTAAVPAPYTMIIARTFKFGGGGVLTLGSDYAASDVPLPSSMGGQGVATLE